MKVYIVTYGEYSEYAIGAVFTTCNSTAPFERYDKP